MEETADFPCDARKRVGQLRHVEQSTANGTANKFLVNYQNKSYDIHEFLRYHPGGKKILNHYENRSLDKAFDENPHSKAALHLLQEFMSDNEKKYQEHEKLIDWDAPILGQVGSLGDKYWEWVNLPVNRQIRLFKSDVLEFMTITPWYLIPIVWIPMSTYFICIGLTRMNTNTGNALLEVLLSYISGILLWSLIEYVLHREVFHFKPPADSKLLITLHFVIHGVHHKAPFDNRRLVFPPLPALLIAKGIWSVYEAIFSATMFPFVTVGTLSGYVFYDLMHYYLHHGAPKAGTYMYNLKRVHNYHHFSHHDLGYGISSKVWDYVFGTTICLRQLAKPIEW
ncbi:dihydroceramide fatty acyl 2-hydroxylase FAH2 [Ceratina calcarata]|uniref:Fatty acid 2-hydroxylase n=1 Tax=Ceratina calcarata TaxID=156304 RepID=A0AAJ7RYW4_9HYME|nr:dihydroceramide fatty acyl 2-hydroxylase FAH2 [Ceratina calcarata]